VQTHDVETIEQVLAEASRADLGFEVGVGGGNDPHINAPARRGAQPPRCLLLERPQELGLELRRHVSDFIEQQRSAVGSFEQSGLGGFRIGKCSALVPKQLALQEVRGNGGAIQLDEWAGRSGPAIVQRTREQLFTGAGVTGDEDRGIGMRENAGGTLECGAERRTLPDDLAERVRLCLESRERAAGERRAPASHGCGHDIVQGITIIGERKVISGTCCHRLRGDAMARVPAHRDYRHVGWHGHPAQESGEIGFATSRGQEYNRGSDGQIAFRRPPLRERHSQLAGQQRPELSERVAEPDYEECGVGCGHDRRMVARG